MRVNERGSTAVIVAMALVPITLAALGAVDVARATAAKLVLQDALDAATLATAKKNVNDAAALQTTGDRIFRQNLALDSSVTLTSDKFVFGASGGLVVGDATAAVKPLILGMVNGGHDIAVGAHTEVKRAGNQLEIALVLDNTGSMAGDKIDNLQQAAKDFIDAMSRAATQSGDSEAVKISLVPFSQTVHLDASKYGTAVWLDQSAASPINSELFQDESGNPIAANRFALFKQLSTTWGGCVETRKAPYDVQDTPPTEGVTLITPYFWPDEPDKSDKNDGSANNNYISDGSFTATSPTWPVRQGATAKYKSTSNLSTSKGPNKGCDMSVIMPLSTDFNALKSAVDKMKATGNTNIPIGMAWGWFTLSPFPPFADGVAYGTPKHKKIVILMTDGDNTMADSNNWNGTDYSGVGYIWQKRILDATLNPLPKSSSDGQRTAALDSRLALLCTNMKAADKDIEIFTMRVEVRSGTSTVLKDCASGADHYYDVQDSADMDAVFQQIAGQIAALHLAK